MTPRRAAVLALNLSAGSATWASCGFDAAWTSETHMAATILDVLRGANWQRGGGSGSKPQPIPRPGDEMRKLQKLSYAAANAQRFAARRTQRVQDQEEGD